jgi:hypothetical protein
LSWKRNDVYITNDSWGMITVMGNNLHMANVVSLAWLQIQRRLKIIRITNTKTFKNEMKNTITLLNKYQVWVSFKEIYN